MTDYKDIFEKGFDCALDFFEDSDSLTDCIEEIMDMARDLDSDKEEDKES